MALQLDARSAITAAQQAMPTYEDMGALPMPASIQGKTLPSMSFLRRTTGYAAGIGRTSQATACPAELRKNRAIVGVKKAEAAIPKDACHWLSRTVLQSLLDLAPQERRVTISRDALIVGWYSKVAKGQC